MPRSEYLTPSEVAAMLRVTLKTVYVWLNKGQLKGRKFGGGWRIERSEVMPKERGR